MSKDEVFIFVIRSKCFGDSRKSTEFVSKCYRIFITNISFVDLGPVIVCDFSCLRPIHAYVQTYLCCDNSVIRRHTFKRGICLTICCMVACST